MFEPALVELRIVEGRELRRQAPESPNEPELSDDDVDNETKTRLPREFEAVLGFSLHVAKRISRREKIRVQVVAAISRKGEVADFVCRVEGATHQNSSGLDVPRPGNDKIPEGHVGTGLEAMQSALLHQFVTEPAESESGPVVAKVGSENHAKPDIGEARSVTVTMLEAEIGHPTNHE